MLKNKFKKIILLAIALAMMAANFSTNVFAGGDLSLCTCNCEGLFKDCCTGNDAQNNTNNNGKNYTFNKESGHLTISDTCTEVVPVASYLNCKSLKSVTIPNGVTKICNEAFKDCSGLTTITIPNRVTYIGNNAFDGCEGLTSVTLGKGVKFIGDYAFYGCTGLKSVTIPNSDTKIGQNAFDKNVTVLYSEDKCNSIDNIFPPGNTIYPNISPRSTPIIPDNIYAPMDSYTELSPLLEPYITTFKNGHLIVGKDIENKKIEQILNRDKDEIKKVTIEDGVTKIADNAFQNCTNLTSVTIPNSVTEIGKFAFDGCMGLKEITIPISVKTVGYGAFWNCRAKIIRLGIAEQRSSNERGRFERSSNERGRFERSSNERGRFE